MTTISSLLGTAWKTVSWTARIGCCVHVLHSYVYEISETQGESMLPTLNYSGDYVHTNKLCCRGRGVGVGDIVVAAKPTDPGQRVCKRITGMAGDVIQVDPSKAYGKEKEESVFIKVPAGHCWVTGDNLSTSLDSRTYGVLPLALIKGKIFAVTTREGKALMLGNTLE